jgi:flagellar hook protein FlgE
MGFLKTGPNTWATEVYAVPATDVTQPGGLLSSGTMKFNGDGSLDRAGSTPALFNGVTPTWTNGASSVPIDLQLGDDKGINGIVQSSDVSALLSSTINGGVLGNLASIDISKTGRVSAIFADGTTREVFQLPVATFPNPDGLTRVSGNGYTPSKTSGSPTMKVPGSLGAGNLLANNLESSTVDLASEFTNMIRFQRAYSASSKIITTVDEMLQEVSSLKR